MQQISLNDLSNFFATAQWPEVIERRPTFFSIAGFPHYENVMSNVYQFFFRTDSPHGMGSLCLDALLDVIRITKPDFSWQSKSSTGIQAFRELGVSGGQRLDILLHNGPDENNWREANAAILVENKVYHRLANDLGNYWDSVSSETLGDQNKTAVVMGLHPERLPAPWIYISHLEWAKAVEVRLGSVLYRAEPRYLTLLLELIENIRTMTSADENFKELLPFFQFNRAAISRAEQIRGQLMQQVPTVLRAALAPNYTVWTSAESLRDGWLIINAPGKPPLKYILGYRQVFHNDEVIPNFRIALISEDNSHDKATIWRDKLSSTLEARNSELQDDERHYVIGKTYELSPSNYHRFPQLIIEKIKNEWQPLEVYWLKATE